MSSLYSQGFMTPQKKKEKFYKRERRNSYGQNAKASIKCIRRRKRVQARAGRRLANQVLSASLHDLDAMSDSVLLPISYVQPISYSTWSKAPDQPLGDQLTFRLNHAIMNAVFKYQAVVPDLLPMFLTQLSTSLHDTDLKRYQHTLTLAKSGGSRQFCLPLTEARNAWKILRAILAEKGIEPLARRRADVNSSAPA